LNLLDLLAFHALQRQLYHLLLLFVVHGSLLLNRVLDFGKLLLLSLDAFILLFGIGLLVGVFAVLIFLLLLLLALPALLLRLLLLLLRLVLGVLLAFALFLLLPVLLLLVGHLLVVEQGQVGGEFVLLLSEFELFRPLLLVGGLVLVVHEHVQVLQELLVALGPLLP
jgi:hypothetical protein